MTNHLNEIMDYSKQRIEELQKEIEQTIANYNALIGRKEEAVQHQKFVQELLDKNPPKADVIKHERPDDKVTLAKKS